LGEDFDEEEFFVSGLMGVSSTWISAGGISSSSSSRCALKFYFINNIDNSFSNH
jgi:hypothetical protein